MWVSAVLAGFQFFASQFWACACRKPTEVLGAEGGGVIGFVSILSYVQGRYACWTRTAVHLLGFSIVCCFVLDSEVCLWGWCGRVVNVVQMIQQLKSLDLGSHPRY